MDRIMVQATDPHRVGLWEQHPEHPGGEAFVTGTQPVEVAETPAVQKALAEGRLRKVARRNAKETK